jgi:V/A-type H+/Na+-transporting ATPase subunit D
MERLPVSINKGNLLRLEEERSFARDGLELLEEKKEALMGHIRSLSSKAERLRLKMNQELGEAYAHSRESIILFGRHGCERVSLASRAGEEVEIKERSFMGVALPLVHISLPRLTPSHGFIGAGVSMDAVAQSIHRSLEIIAELAEVEVGLFRLVTEIRKTIQRVNALENIYIPLYEATIKHIEQNLEEKEREFLFQLKRQKNRREETGHESL